MNTNPDEAKLALWLDDELKGEELASFDAWAAGQPEHAAAREETRRWRAMIAAAIPASEEPAYPDFFNSRIAQAIREQVPEKPIVTEKRRISWTSWLMPLTACAGMVIAFWVGTKARPNSEVDVTGAPRAIPVEPIVYTPENGVKAELFASKEASAMVIVLDGVRAIPDALDFSETTSLPMDREIDSTADSDQEFESGTKP
ncbi:MAG: hypothetical protein ABI162_08860 [Luteolibacter sp.]